MSVQPSAPAGQGILHLAEIPYEDGTVRFRYAFLPNPTNVGHVRHGLFCEYSPSGEVISEGNYEHGLESGRWTDYYANGQVAAQGVYLAGKHHGLWRFWGPDGTEQEAVTYENGNAVA